MDYEKINQAVTVLDENVCEISSLTESIEESYAEGIIDEKDTSVSIKEFLESQFGSNEELEMKKLMALAAVASGSESSSVELASQIDAAAVSAKAAYKVSTGELDVIEASDIIIDHGVARLNAIIQSNLNMDLAGEVVSNIIGTVFPPAKAAKPYIKAIVKNAEPVVRKCIDAGMKTIGNFAKQTVRKVVTGVKNVAKNLLKA